MFGGARFYLMNHRDGASPRPQRASCFRAQRCDFLSRLKKEWRFGDEPGNSLRDL
jgi:hypothetical protein